MAAEYFAIEDGRVAAIANMVRDQLDNQNVPTFRVREYIVADWPEGQEHQDWLDTSSDEEVASWVAQGYTDEWLDKEPEAAVVGCFYCAFGARGRTPQCEHD